MVPASEPEYVRLAAEDLASDVKKITGKSLAIVERQPASGDYVFLGSINRPDSAAMLGQLVPTAVGALRGKWEAYRVHSVIGPTRGPGHRRQATGDMFGLYAFIESIWASIRSTSDREPKPQSDLPGTACWRPTS